MLKKHMAACLVVTAFAAAPALAQTSTTPSGSTDRPTASGSGSTATGSSAMQPTTGATGATGTGSAATGSSTMSQAGAQGGAMQGQFMTQMQPNQVMASKLIGTRVVSSNNESIGDINDVIVDRNGQAIAAVVGVGGFLGIGEKDVAVPFNSLEFMTAQQASAMNANGNNATAPATTGSTAGAGTTGVAGTTGSTAGSGAMTSGNTTSNNAGASGNMASDGPDRVVLRMTKAELQAAPAFDADGNSNASGSGTTAPKQ
jgi:sporulation protein YlmC with PRC-barrel domain